MSDVAQAPFAGWTGHEPWWVQLSSNGPGRAMRLRALSPALRSLGSPAPSEGDRTRIAQLLHALPIGGVVDSPYPFWLQLSSGHQLFLEFLAVRTSATGFTVLMRPFLDRFIESGGRPFVVQGDFDGSAREIGAMAAVSALAAGTGMIE